MANNENNLWKLLWEYDPNALIVVDKDMNITLVNPAFSKLFNVKSPNLIGKPAEEILGEVKDFKKAWENNEVIKNEEKEYPKHQLYVRQVIFPIKDENVVACIIVDLSQEWHRRQEMMKLKAETLAKVNEVVDNQMKVAQEIAGLLGETTAETKVSLLKILKMVDQELV
jgi:PAS domain S-box-containing protein